jgi:hypothetical protein
MNIHLPKTRLEIWTECSEAVYRCGYITKAQLERQKKGHQRLNEMWGKKLDEKDRSKKC